MADVNHDDREVIEYDTENHIWAWFPDDREYVLKGVSMVKEGNPYLVSPQGTLSVRDPGAEGFREVGVFPLHDAIAKGEAHYEACLAEADTGLDDGPDV